MKGHQGKDYMKKILTAVIFCLLASEGFAQTVAGTVGPNGTSGTVGFGLNNNNPAFSSTPQEGWWRGTAAYMSGFANYLQSLGAYENLHEMAVDKNIQNNYNRIQLRWAIKDEIAARKAANKKDYIALENERLDRLEKKAELDKRKLDLQKKGILPTPPKPSMGWRGHKFSSFEEFKKSPLFGEFLEEARDREFASIKESFNKELRYQEAIKISAMLRKKSYEQIDRDAKRHQVLKQLEKDAEKKIAPSTDNEGKVAKPANGYIFGKFSKDELPPSARALPQYGEKPLKETPAPSVK